MSGYKYYYTKNEANFGKPIRTEVPGGTHLTFEVVLRRSDRLIALRRPDGLHDGPKNALYFPHGLIRFGETVEKCVSRIVSEQAGFEVIDVKVHSLDSWVDDDNHWHLALNVVATISGRGRLRRGVSEFVEFSSDNIPPDLAWWTKDDLIELFGERKR